MVHDIGVVYILKTANSYRLSVACIDTMPFNGDTPRIYFQQ